MLAADNTIYRPIVQTLSTRFDEAKLYQQVTVDGAVAWGTGFVDYLGFAVDHWGNAAQYLPVFIIWQAACRTYRKQCIANDAQYLLYNARADRVHWLGVLEQRFPQLATLGLGRQRWEELRDRAKPFSKRFSDSWGVPEFLFTWSLRGNPQFAARPN